MQIRHFNIPIFIPELACPFQCVFCDQSKISGQKTVPTQEEIIQKIESHLATINTENTDIRIAFFGGSFTALPISDQTKLLQLVQPYLQQKQIKGIRISTRPDYITNENLDILKMYGVTHIELGAQSLDTDVLKLSGRGHSVEDVRIASQLIVEKGFVLGLQMMIGLPGDTKETSLKTAKRIVEFGATETRIYPTLVIEGTQLHHKFISGTYKELSLQDAVQTSADLFRYFSENNINILRIGLHPSTDLEIGKSLVAGPFRPHFKELVLSEIWNQILQNYSFDTSQTTCEIVVSPNEINYAIGYNSCNRNWLQKVFKSIEFKVDNSLKKTDFYVHYR